MSFRSNLLGMMFLPSLLLVGCGGGDGDDFKLFNGEGDFSGNAPTTEEETPDGEEGSKNTSTVSYLPLSVFERYKSYSGYNADGLFQGELHAPLIKVYMINPISAKTLKPVDSAKVGDYRATVDDVEIDPSENFPVLQKVLGNTAALKTALVFDMTGSTSEVDLPALVAEAKSYIAKVHAHSNSIIKNQEFVIWSFGENDPALEDVNEITSGFTSNAGDLELALDSLTLKSNASSNLHKAIVKAVGRYYDDSVTPVIDYANDGNNDLYDRVTSNGIQLSQMVIFSSGPDNMHEFEQLKMEEAIQSQGFLKYDADAPTDPTAPTDPGPSDPAPASDTDIYTNKAVFYYVIGTDSPGDTYQALSDVAETTEVLTLSNNKYSFSDRLIDNQLDAIDLRINLDNQYIYRYAFLPRQGDHTSIFSSRTDNFNYSLTSEYKADVFTDLGWDALGTPAYELSSLVEITGSKGEYLANAEVDLQNETTFRPVVRWTNETYEPSDYTWTLTSGSGTSNADGSYTVTSISGSQAILELENTARSETAQITVKN